MSRQQVGLLVVLVVVFLQACHDRTVKLPSSQVANHSVRQGLCKSQPVRATCSEVEIGTHIQRYQLIRAAKPTDQLVIVDFGGPGVPVLADDRLADFKKGMPQLDGYNLLVIEEPWVTSDVEPVCAASLSAYYRGMRSALDITAAAKAVHEHCQLEQGRWGFTPSSYRAAVDAITAKEQLQIKGFVGHSWGGVRLSYLAERPFSFVVLVRPFPLNADADALIQARSRLVEVGGMGQKLDRETKLPGRSLPVNAFDQLSAKIALGYVDDAEFPVLSKTLKNADAALAGRLSDSLWGRFGTDSISPSLLAELDETCGLIGGPSRLQGTDSTAGIIAARFAPCGIGNRRRGSTLFAHTRDMCIVSSAQDSVTPAALIASSSYELPSGQIRWVKVKTRSHSSFDGISVCFDSSKTSS